MTTTTPEIPVEHVDTADELWECLSPTRKTPNSEDQIVYRGHRDADWGLVPLFLREESSDPIRGWLSKELEFQNQAWIEFQLIRSFIDCCDENGVSVPNDSIKFRLSNLRHIDFKKYHDFPEDWPNDEMAEAMALAQLHGLPTRLLDWSANPYVAAYFASSDALQTCEDWLPDQRIAIIELNAGPKDITHCGGVRVLRVRGSISENLVAQQGLFTIHPLGRKGEKAIVKPLEEYLPEPPNFPVRKLTIPITECVRLYELCTLIGINAARLFPDADGSSLAAREGLLYSIAQNESRIKT